MNQMTTALREAGISMPVNQRIWQWLADHGEHSGRTIALALNAPVNNVSSLLKDLAERRMVTVRTDMDRSTNRLVMRYTAVPMEHYELLPKQKRDKQHTATPTPAKATAETLPGVTPYFTAEKFLGKLTLEELRLVHEFTKRLFK